VRDVKLVWDSRTSTAEKKLKFVLPGRTTRTVPFSKIVQICVKHKGQAQTELVEGIFCILPGSL